MKRGWVITIFGDIHGFKKWQRSLVATPEIREPVMKKYFKELEYLARLHPAQWKRRGDGFSMIMKIESRNGARQTAILKILEDIRGFTGRVTEIIHNCEWPPDGFRVRLTAGWADEYKVCDLDEPGRRHQIEYISDLINLCEQLLYIRPDIPLICHKSLIHLIGEKKLAPLNLQKVNVNSRDIYKTVRVFDEDDIRDLYSLSLGKKLN